jgi:hypothetical protein
MILFKVVASGNSKLDEGLSDLGENLHGAAKSLLTGYDWNEWLKPVTL